jgi:hypothetical protein
MAAAKRISLTDNEDMLEVGENLKDVTSFHEFKQSLRAARIAQQFTQPWNMSITALESFLINTNFLADKVVANAKGVSILSAFCNHVFLLNSQNWRSKKDFLDVVDLVSVWAAWHPGHIGPAETSKDAKPGTSGTAANKKNNNNSNQVTHSEMCPSKSAQVAINKQLIDPNSIVFLMNWLFK